MPIIKLKISAQQAINDIQEDTDKTADAIQDNQEKLKALQNKVDNLRSRLGEKTKHQEEKNADEQAQLSKINNTIKGLESHQDSNGENNESGPQEEGSAEEESDEQPESHPKGGK